MKIAVVNVGMAGYRDPSFNEARLGLVRTLVARAAEQGAGLIAFPAGWVAAWPYPTPGAAGDAPSVWQQRSATRTDADRVPDADASEVRMVHAGEGEVAVLICGEMFNARIRDAIRERAKVVVTPGHEGAGWTAHRGLKALKTEAFACAHLEEAPGVQHWYGADGERKGERRRDLWFESDELWAAGALYDVAA